MGHDDRPTQTKLCVKCHQGLAPQAFAQSAHGVPQELLARLPTRDILVQPVSFSTNLPGPRSVACATCHREHHGATHDLTAMSDRACQSCHRQTYENFASDHPEFASWPYERRTPIAFDHGSHQSKHFKEKMHAFDCRKCHVEDHTRSVQLLARYDATCASCHDEKIATSVSRGVPMLVLPTLDVDALRSAGHDIGPWPAAATGDFDGRLTPPMKLLLAADQAAAKAMAVLGPEFEVFDIDAANREQLAACAELAAAIKRLIAELKESGDSCVEQRLTALLGQKVQSKDVKILVSGLSGDTLRLAADEWLGKAAAADNADRKSTSSAAGAWYYDAAKLSIRYQPAGHADPILKAWLDFAARASGGGKSPLASAMLKELTRPTAPGLCATCHSVEALKSGQLTVHWQPADRTTSPRGFTKFSHGPHVLLPELTDCSACHTINPGANAATSYVGWNANSFVRDFQPMAKQACANCHTPKAAGDGCQKCHNYHVSVQGLELRVESKTLPSQLSTHDPQPSRTSSDTPPVRR
jgi:predicted CXXCH cytochrome family protein